MLVYYAQKDFFEVHKRWAASLEELRMDVPGDVQLELTPDGYEVRLQFETVSGPRSCRLTHDGALTC